MLQLRVWRRLGEEVAVSFGSMKEAKDTIMERHKFSQCLIVHEESLDP